MFKSQSYLDSWKEKGAQIQLMGLGTVYSRQEKLTDLMGGQVLWDNTKHWFIDFTIEFILGIYVLGVHTFLQIGKLKIILLKKILFGVLYYGHGDSVAKNPPANAGDVVWSPSCSQEDLLEKEMTTHSSILSWEISWTEETGMLKTWSHKELETT